MDTYKGPLILRAWHLLTLASLVASFISISGAQDSARSHTMLRTTPPSVIRSASLTQEPELWRFAFTRFKHVYGYAYHQAPTSIALDSRNFPHISFVYGNYLGLRHSFFNGDGWVTETVDDVYPFESAIAIDSQDHARVTYTAYPPGGYDPLEAWVKYAYYNGSSWTTEVLDENGFWSSIALDSQDNPHVAYFNESGLQYAFFDGFDWTMETVDGDCLHPTTIQPRCPFIALDFQNHPHIAYSGGLTETDKPLRYASFNGSSWNIRTIDAEGYSASMILDSSYNAHISYRNATALKYAHFDGLLWNIEVVAFEGEAETSIAIDSESRPHIVYRSDTKIKYAYNGPNGWNTTTLDEDEGYDYVPWRHALHCSLSLTLGSDDKLQLSYIGGRDNCPELRLAVGTKQYLTSFEFSDGSGAALYAQPSSVRAVSPEVPGLPACVVWFTAFSNQWLDHGNWTLQEVMWQGSDVRPAANDTYDPEPAGMWAVQTLIYALNIRNKYQFDNLLAENVTLTFPNGTMLVKQPIEGWINMTQVQTGTILIGTPISVSESERYVLLSPTGISLTESTVIDSAVWSHEITTLDVSCYSPTAYAGFHVNITGRLTHIPAGNISGATILLTYRVPGVPSWNLITSTLTKSDGTYSVVWFPSATGSYTIKAGWSGSADYLGASSTISLAVGPFRDESIFSVVSNSTISELTFNSTDWSLGFTVAGPDDSAGYVRLTVAKTLVGNLSNVRVYINDLQMQYSIFELEDSWLLSFTYHHSTNQVRIDLDVEVIPEFPAWMLLPLLLTMSTLALIMSGVKRKRREHTRKGG